MVGQTNYMHRMGHVSCIRCDFETSDDMSFEEQDAIMITHLTVCHPNWQTDGGASIIKGRLPKSAEELLRESLATLQTKYDILAARYAFHENQRLCIGFNGGCDGDLEGTEHDENCPARSKDLELRPHLYAVKGEDQCAAWGCDKPQIKPFPACAEHLQDYRDHPEDWLPEEKKEDGGDGN